MSKDYEIRHPRMDEAKEIAAVHIKSWEQAYAGQLPERFWDESAYEQRVESWREMLANPAHRARTRVVESAGDIVGFAQIGPPREDDIEVEHELYAIYLLEEHQGTGAAEELISELLNDKSASLWVFKDNPRAQAFYRKYGFESDGAETDLGEERDSDSLRGICEIRMVREDQ